MKPASLSLMGCFVLTVLLWPVFYVRLRYEPLAFMLKSIGAAFLLSLPAALVARQRASKLTAWKVALLGAAAAILGQLILYSLLPDLDSGAAIGLVEGVHELLWDATFKGAPESLYGGMALLGGGAAAVSWIVGRSAARTAKE